ncbi:hypothetical protein [Streptomyces sp. NPDC001221]
MSDEIERRKSPTPGPGKPSEEYGFDHSEDLRSRVTRLTFQVLDHIEQNGAIVDGEANPDIEALCALIDAGTGLRRLGLERRLGGAVLEYRARRPLNGGGRS